MSLYHAADIVSHLSLSLSLVFSLGSINCLITERKKKRQRRKSLTGLHWGLHKLSIPQTTEAGWASTQSLGEAAT